jgi:hypothetical protein
LIPDEFGHQALQRASVTPWAPCFFVAHPITVELTTVWSEPNTWAIEQQLQCFDSGYTSAKLAGGDT